MLSLNSLNCWNTLRALDATAWQVIASANAKKSEDWAISSQVPKGLGKGSTTRKSNLEQMKFPRIGSICLKIDNYGDSFKNMAEKKFFATKDELEKKYIELGSLNKVASFYNVSKKLILNKMKKFNIERNETLTEKNKSIVDKIKCYDSSCTIKEVAKELNLSTASVRKNAKKIGIKFKDPYHVGFSITHNGYKKLRNNNENVLEHRKIIEKDLGRNLEENEIVHHIDGDKMNNDISNLKIVSRAEHIKIHNPLKFRWASKDIVSSCAKV